MVTDKVFSPLVPNFWLRNVRLFTEVVISAIPVPLRAECCGLVVALSVSVSVALCTPSVAGANATSSVQKVLCATVIGIAPQVPPPVTVKCAGSDVIALETISEWCVPVLVTFTVLATV